MSENRSDSSASHQSPSADSEDEFQRQAAAAAAKKHTKEEILAVRDATLAEIADTDVLLQAAIDAFFGNRTVDCMNMLEENKDRDPLVMMGTGLIAFLRYVLSMEQAHADVASADISAALAYSKRVLDGDKGYLAKMSMRRKKGWCAPGVFRANVIHAESEALRGFVLIIQGGLMSYMKGGLALRRAYQNYSSLEKEIKARQQEALEKLSDAEVRALESGGNGEVDIGLDRNSIHSVNFGLGIINIAISMLPDHIIRVVKVLGMEGDRRKGVQCAQACFRSNTLLSAFASASLLGLLGALPLCCGILVASYAPFIHQVAEDTLAAGNTKDSLFHLWLMARAKLVTRDLDTSTEMLLRCLTISESGQVKEGMPQLRSFVYYDLAYTYLLKHQWDEARECFNVLGTTSHWSAMYYRYAQACCYDAIALECELEGGSADEVRALRHKAHKQYWKTAHYKATKMGGKVRATDQFVSKRLDEMIALYGISHPNKDYKKKLAAEVPMPAGVKFANTVTLPAYEISFLFNLGLRMPRSLIQHVIRIIDGELIKEKIVEPSNGTVGGGGDGSTHHRNDDGDASADKNSAKAVQSDDGESKAATKPDHHTAATAAAHVDTSALVAAINKASGEYAETTKKGKKSKNGALPPNYTVMFLAGLRAYLLAESPALEDRQVATELIAAVLAAPAYKDKDWSLSYVQPSLFYEKANIAFNDPSGGMEAASIVLQDLAKAYPDAHYYFHSMVELRAHLGKSHFKEAGRAAERAEHAEKHEHHNSSSSKKKHVDPNSA